MDGGGGGKPVWKHLTPVTWAFKDGEDGEFELYLYLDKWDMHTLS